MWPCTGRRPASTVENSCVWVVPGSHVWEQERAKEWVERGRKDFQLPGAVPAETEPGDVLLHHTKVLHGSTVNTSPELRRVVYFDNRAARWNDSYHWFDRSVIEKRCRLYQYALHERKIHPYPSDDESFLSCVIAKSAAMYSCCSAARRTASRAVRSPMRVLSDET